jgi:hypothetical protein
MILFKSKTGNQPEFQSSIKNEQLIKLLFTVEYKIQILNKWNLEFIFGICILT